MRPVETSPYGRRFDAEHVAGLLRSETEPIDEDQHLPLSAWELGDGVPNVMARGQRDTEIFLGDDREGSTCSDQEPAETIPVQVQRRSIDVAGG